MAIKLRTWRVALLAGCATVALGTALPAAASAEGPARQFSITAQDLDSALKAFAMTSGHDVVFDPALVKGRTTAGVTGAMSDEEALRSLLAGANLAFEQTPSGGFVVRAPRFQTAANDEAGGSDGTVQTLIVTAQKREENIQDVPIAISAFSEKSLQEQKIEGGFDLLKAIPNVTFSKNNFTSYNFSIRGIGTKAVSATTDPGVAVSFNNTALLQNRLFEQEYFDVERVEVLRGPQGTLYGRNATAGVINVITAKPNLHEFDGWVKGEVGNYHAKRLSAMINMPLVTDKLGLRIAGSLTDRQGYDFNEGTGHAVNGRDLWSTRITLQFNPIERLRTQLIWERFNEDDNRSRTSKQLCHHDNGPLEVGGKVLYQTPDWTGDFNAIRRAVFSQGCLPGSLYDDSAFGTPNGLALPFMYGVGYAAFFNASDAATGQWLIDVKQDPYGGMMQSRDLRVISSIKDPKYRAKADVIQLNMDFDLTNNLTVYSQTVYNKDQTYSTQDFNRFNTVPIFNDTSNWTAFFGDNPFTDLAPGGLFRDPQLGKSDKLVGFDIASAKGTQFGQELRIQSDFDGPINFSAGANYTRFKTLVDYYVFFNVLSALAILPPFNFLENVGPGGDPYTTCFGWIFGTDTCPYVDPNPLESINGEGHNYFRSKNPYKLASTAAFGEAYWNINDALKITAGLRYTDDRKTFIPVPSQVLLAGGPMAGGDVPQGYPELPAIKQHWGEWTGRLGVDWKPELSFTDQTMLYAFYSRGYKGGGANPPTPGFGTKSLIDYRPFVENQIINSLTASGNEKFIPQMLERFSSPILRLTGVEYETTFKPEFVNAFEIGAKNTLLGGALTMNGDAFFYDYKDYQISQIRDRTAVNENFDAKIWGLELQSTFAPSRDLQLVANIGYLDTKIGKGMKSIDIMDRTAGNPDFVVTRPWIQMPSNCIVPVFVAKQWAEHNNSISQWQAMCGGTGTALDINNVLVSINNGDAIVDPNTGLLYDPLYYNGQNGTVDIHGGAGIAKDLSGNELPNAPHWTMNFGGQYGHDILDGSWRATVRADAYWQSQSWARVYNDNGGVRPAQVDADGNVLVPAETYGAYDKLHGWYNVNLSVWFERPEDDLKIEFYAKNILDKTPITDAFLNSDDTALTTNVFTLDPRLIGLSIHKGF